MSGQSNKDSSKINKNLFNPDAPFHGLFTSWLIPITIWSSLWLNKVKKSFQNSVKKSTKVTRQKYLLCCRNGGLVLTRKNCHKNVQKLSNKMLNHHWIFTQLKAKDTVIQMRITFWKLDINFKQLTNSDRRNKIEVVLYRSPITTTAQSNVDHGPLVLVTFFRQGN